MGVACRAVGERRGTCKVLVRKPEEKRPLGKRLLRWEETAKWVIKKWACRAWAELIWLRIGTSDGLL
jgi:hypothetical protein